MIIVTDNLRRRVQEDTGQTSYRHIAGKPTDGGKSAYMFQRRLLVFLFLWWYKRPTSELFTTLSKKMVDTLIVADCPSGIDPTRHDPTRHDPTLRLPSLSLTPTAYSSTVHYGEVGAATICAIGAVIEQPMVMTLVSRSKGTVRVNISGNRLL